MNGEFSSEALKAKQRTDIRLEFIEARGDERVPALRPDRP